MGQRDPGSAQRGERPGLLGLLGEPSDWADAEHRDKYSVAVPENESK